MSLNEIHRNIFDGLHTCTSRRFHYTAKISVLISVRSRSEQENELCSVKQKYVEVLCLAASSRMIVITKNLTSLH